MPQPRGPSNLSDRGREILEPLPSSAEKLGRPPKRPLKCVAEAVFYLPRSGCAWRILLREYPHWQTAYYHLRRFRSTGLWRLIFRVLRSEVRRRAG